MSSQLLHARVNLNEKRTCSVSDCTSHRAGISLYCGDHRAKQKKYGSPFLTPYKRSHEYKFISERATSFLSRNQTADAIQAAEEWIDEQLEAVSLTTHVTNLNEVWKHLANSPVTVTASDVLKEVISVYCYLQRLHPYPDIKAQERYLGYAISNLVPQHSRITRKGNRQSVDMRGLAKSGAGHSVINALGIFLLRISNFIELEVSEEDSLKERLMASTFQ